MPATAQLRDDLVRLASRVASMLSTTRPGQHQADLREVHEQLVRIAALPSREAELEELLRAARGAMGSARAHDAGEVAELLERIDALLP